MDRLADTRRRASAVTLVAGALSVGRYPADPATLAAIGRVAGRAALDLARVERDLALAEVSR